ncbi:hypothetical protein LTR85_004722 [Meristemomyces frigidus]|nr:hypothetical protein LTR85_004722 [Meristemomyces frigidus]
MADTTVSPAAVSQAKPPSKERNSLAKAKATIKYMVDPKTGPQPNRLRTRAFLRSLRYFTIFVFWRLVRYAKYAAVGAIVAAISGTAIGSVASGAAFVIAPTGILGGAGIGLLWAVGKFGWRRARARVKKGEHDGHADPRKDEHEDAQGATGERVIQAPRADPWTVEMVDSEAPSPIKAVCFDFMGTCLDWHSSITAALPDQLSETERSRLALEWRQCYFDANTKRQAEGEPPEDIDITHRRVLDELLLRPEQANCNALFTPEVLDAAIAAWHTQKAWPDVHAALQSLQEKGLEVYVHANGTTRLQLDLVKSSGLLFDLLISSQILGVYKPALEAYSKGLELIKRTPEECIMVAAHAYDLRGAKAVGMKTVYVHRWTDDVREDQEVVRGECDAYLESMEGLVGVVESLGKQR